MSNTNSPAQRPVQHNPYTITPLQQPQDRHASHSPPPPLEHTAVGGQQGGHAGNTPKAASPGTLPLESAAPGRASSGPRGSTTPQLGFMASGYSSMYVATPQQGPNHPRVTPPPLDPSNRSPQHMPANAGGQQQQRSTFGGGGGGGGQQFTPYGPGPGGGSSSNGTNAFANAFSGGTFGTFGVTSGGSNNNNNSGGWGGFHGSDVPSYAMPGSNAGGGGSSGGGGNFNAFSENNSPSSFTPYGGGGGGSTFGGGRGSGQNADAQAFQPTFGPPRTFHSYPTPSHASQQQTQGQQGQQGGGNGGGMGGGGGMGMMGGMHGGGMQHQHQQQQHQRGGNQRGGNRGEGGISRGVSTGRAAHVFLQNKLRYLPLSPEFFVAIPPQRMQLQQALHGGEMEVRPIQMYSGRGREMQTVCPTADLFVAQLPFNMELSALQHIFDAVAPISCDIMHAAPHYKRGRSYDGCAFVKVSQAVAAILVETFHKAALFDQEGVWIADTPEQREELAQYCAFMQQKSPQERRQMLQKPIPFSAMTVEFANRSYSF